MFKGINFLAFLLVLAIPGTFVSAQTVAPAIERHIEMMMGDGDSFIGVQLEEVTKENFGKLGLKEVRGVLVGKVSENSPAKQGGIQDGDVIVRFNGEDVTSRRKMTRLIGEVAPGHQAKIVVVRDGSEREINVTVGKHPSGAVRMAMPGGVITEGMALPGGMTRTVTVTAMPGQEPVITSSSAPYGQVMAMPAMPDGMKTVTVTAMGEKAPDGSIKPGTMRVMSPVEVPTVGNVMMSADGNGGVFVTTPDGQAGPNGNFVFASPRVIGVGISELTKQLGDYFGVTDGKGVLVTNVNENSPAAKGGIKAGDVIVEIDGKSVADAGDLMRGMIEKKEGEVAITVVRNKARQTVKVTPEVGKGMETFFNSDVQMVPGGQVKRVVGPAKTNQQVRVVTRRID